MRPSDGEEPRGDSRQPDAVKASAEPDAPKAAPRSADPSSGESGAEAGSQGNARGEARAAATETETSDFLYEAWFWLLVLVLLSVSAAVLLWPDLVTRPSSNPRVDELRTFGAGILLGVAGSAAVGAIQESFHDTTLASRRRFIASIKSWRPRRAR